MLSIKLEKREVIICIYFVNFLTLAALDKSTAARYETTGCPYDFKSKIQNFFACDLRPEAASVPPFLNVLPKLPNKHKMN